MNEILVLLGVALFGGLCIYVLYRKVIYPTWKWQEKCNDLKDRIKSENNRDIQLKEFYELA